MTEEQAYGLLQEVFNTVFGRTDLVLTPELTARQVIGWDSLKQLDIIMDIEDRLDVEIGGEKLAGLRNVGDLAALVRAEAAAKAGRALP
jgi:acyl carrier protein